MISYKRSQMVYDYKWTAASDHDNPDVRNFPDDRLLNREEGYEMLHFINSVAKKYNWNGNLSSYQNLERALKNGTVPSNIRSPRKIIEFLQHQNMQF